MEQTARRAGELLMKHFRAARFADGSEAIRIEYKGEVDLVTEFGLAPRADVHFLMTTGQIAMGQAALYVAETTSGKFGVYTMGPRPDGQLGVVIRRHDMVTFREARKE